MPTQVMEGTGKPSVDGQIGADEVEALYANVSNKERQQVFYVQGKPSMLVVDHGSNECFFLKWKTFKNNQRKGRELDPKIFQLGRAESLRAGRR